MRDSGRDAAPRPVLSLKDGLVDARCISRRERQVPARRGWLSARLPRKVGAESEDRLTLPYGWKHTAERRRQGVKPEVQQQI